MVKEAISRLKCIFGEPIGIYEDTKMLYATTEGMFTDKFIPTRIKYAVADFERNTGKRVYFVLETQKGIYHLYFVGDKSEWGRERANLVSNPYVYTYNSVYPELSCYEVISVRTYNMGFITLQGANRC